MTDTVIQDCPACKSLAIIETGEHSKCLDCFTVWETLPPGEPKHADEPYFPFDTPCNNCAFRKDSPERQDKEAWNQLVEKLKKNNSHFYCHKGVPMNAGSDFGFEYPKLPDGKHDIEKMRICRGYLNMKMGHLQKHFKAEKK